MHWKLLWLLLLVVASASPAAAASADARIIARQIDRYLEVVWQREQITPNPIADDATFLRRISLDLIGRVPTIAEVRAFTADQGSDNRLRAVDRLIRMPMYAQHTARAIRRSWFPQTDVAPADFLAEETEIWIAREIQKRTPYDQMIRQLVVVTLYDQGTLPNVGANPRVPLTFLLANEHKPEQMAANSARSFLGINLDCAQCHDHPFARWSQQQFWETAAFFAPPANSAAKAPAELTIAIPDMEQTVSARPISAPAITWPVQSHVATGPQVFANWLTDASNPYFAKNAVNRLWAHVFGAGLLEPLDDLAADHDSPLEGLLEELSQLLVTSGYDLSLLHQAMLSTKAYQRTTTVAETKRASLELFARMRSRPLTGEQLYDSIRIATGLNPLHKDAVTLEELLQRRKFIQMFRLEKLSSSDRSIVQSLALMNGELTAAYSDPQVSPLIVGIADAPFLQQQERVEALFLATLSRAPSQAEREGCVRYLAEHDAQHGLSDILWALMNSVEFSTNH